MPQEPDAPHSLRSFLAEAAVNAAASLEAALLRLPEDRRNWSPGGDARTAADLVAECALLNLSTATLIRTRRFPDDFDMAAYEREKAALAASDTAALLALLHENAKTVAEAIRSAPAEDLDVEIPMPWGPVTLAGLIAYPYWNMSYHEGQINYVASIIGCLK